MRTTITLISILVISLWGAVAFAQKKGTDTANDLSPKEIADFQERCRIKVAEFEEYLPIIVDKTRSEFDRSEAIKAAEMLFNDNSTIQVSSKFSKTPIAYSIGEYLTTLRDTKKYAQIKIAFYEAARVSEFIPDPNGSYRGTATVFQEFRGYDKKGKAIYQDRTRKNISTQLNPELDPFYNEKRWKVLLGNITVEETSDVPVK